MPVVLPFKVPMDLPIFSTVRGGVTYPPAKGRPMSGPTYDEIYERVLEKVERKLAESKNLADREAFAQDIMDALAEAYHQGMKDQIERTRLILCNTPADPLVNPYERYTRV